MDDDVDVYRPCPAYSPTDTGCVQYLVIPTNTTDEEDGCDKMKTVYDYVKWILTDSVAADIAKDQVQNATSLNCGFARVLSWRVALQGVCNDATDHRRPSADDPGRHEVQGIFILRSVHNPYLTPRCGAPGRGRRRASDQGPSDVFGCDRRGR
eukprot:2023625-Rhodomonas_salina.1